MGFTMAGHAQKRNPALLRQGPIGTGLSFPAGLGSHNQQQRAAERGQGSAPTGSGAMVCRKFRGHQQPGAMGRGWRVCRQLRRQLLQHLEGIGVCCGFQRRLASQHCGHDLVHGVGIHPVEGIDNTGNFP